MVLVFFVVNLLRIDLYDVVKEIKKGRDTMKTIIKRSILDYLKNPVLWIGLIIIVASMYQCLSSYLQIHYIKQNEQITQNDVALEDADVMDGYIPTSDDKERRREWEDTIKETLMDTSKNGFGFSRQEADHVMKEIQNMDVKTASEFLESQYGYYNAIYAYEDLEIHKGTAEEINHYIERKLSEHSFSWYFAKKFTDFAGLHMAFFATVLLSFLFIQDTRKSTYELYSLIYIVPNLLMICCVYTITAVIFKNPLPAAPILFLHIIYSNMLTMKNDIYYMRPFSIMVRFPGRFFETHVAKMSNINQIILVISSVILVCISVTIWKRRRVH